MNTNPAPVNAGDLPEKPHPFLKWFIASVAILGIFIAGFFTATQTTEPEVVTNTVEKEVPTVPLVCHHLIYNYEQQIDIYKEFAENIELELRGVPSGVGYYEGLGQRRINLNKDSVHLITECNKFL